MTDPLHFPRIMCPACKEEHDAAALAPNTYAIRCARGYAGPSSGGLLTWNLIGIADRDYFDALVEGVGDPAKPGDGATAVARWAL